MRYTLSKSGDESRYLTGNVKIRHENTYMECDSAVIYTTLKRVYAYGHVYINNGDSLDIYADIAQYYGLKKLVVLYDNVIMLNGKLKLLSPAVYYDMNLSLGSFYKGGTVYNGDTKIESDIGTYYKHTSDVYFQRNVVVTDPKFSMTSDTLQYNTNEDLATLHSKTTIVGDNSTIYCHSGHYDTKRQIADFGENTTIDNATQTLHTDSLYYDRNNGIAKTYQDFTFTDKENRISMRGTTAIYREENKYLFAWHRPMMTNYDADDTLYMKADTIISYAQDSSDKRYFYGYRNVRIFKKDMQAKCDSVYYSYEDSTFKMFYEPVLWSDNMQTTGDTIFLLTKNNQASELKVMGNGFITMQSNKYYFDQLKGLKITGYLKNNSIETMDIEGNAESIYYMKDDANDRLIGNNKASSNKMRLFFADKKVDRVKFIGKPEAVFTPTNKLNDDLKTLKGFSWQNNIRPLSPADL